MPAIFDVLCQEAPTATGPSSMRAHRTVPGSHCSALPKSARYGITTSGGASTLKVRDTVLTAHVCPRCRSLNITAAVSQTMRQASFSRRPHTPLRRLIEDPSGDVRRSSPASQLPTSIERLGGSGRLRLFDRTSLCQLARSLSLCGRQKALWLSGAL